jgi:hypothetical protein
LMEKKIFLKKKKSDKKI